MNTIVNVPRASRIWQTASRVLHLAVASSLLVSLISTLLLWDACLLLHVALPLATYVAAFCLTVAVYNLDRLDGPPEDHLNAPQQRQLYAGKTTQWVLLVGVALMTCFGLLLVTAVRLIGVFLVPLLTSLLYGKGVVVPRLKNVLGVKNLVLVATWTLMATAIPVLSTPLDPVPVLMVAVFVFLKIFINSLLFDVRDIWGDRAAGVRTLPVALGRTATFRLLVLLNGALVPWLVLCRLRNYFLPYLWPLTFSVVYGLGYILFFGRRERPRLLYDVLVDGEWVPFTLAQVIAHGISGPG